MKRKGKERGGKRGRKAKGREERRREREREKEREREERRRRRENTNIRIIDNNATITRTSPNSGSERIINHGRNEAIISLDPALQKNRSTRRRRVNLNIIVQIDRFTEINNYFSPIELM